MKYIGLILIAAMILGFNSCAWAWGHGGGHFHAGNNRIHKRLHYRIHQQRTQTYIENGLQGGV